MILDNWYEGFHGKSIKCTFVDSFCDNGEELIIYKKWLRSKKRWDYSVVSKNIYNFNFKMLLWRGYF